MRIIALIICLSISNIAFSAESVSEKPESLLISFYTTLQKSQPDLEQELNGLSSFFSSRLNKLLKQAELADEIYMKKFPTDVPPFEHGSCVFYGGGDCDFSSFRIEKLTKIGKIIKGTVELSLIDQNRPNEKPYRWMNTVTMKMENNSWVIDDIEYFNSSASKELREIEIDALNGAK